MEGPGGQDQPEVVVVGCGAVGLPLAVALASRGRRVIGYDTDTGKVAALAAGRTTLVEEGLADALREALNHGAIAFDDRLTWSGEPRVFVIAVPTPATASGFDSAPLASAMRSVSAAAFDGDVVCLRSTVPIGTARELAAMHPRLTFAACPDRSLSGRALADQFETPHLVGGVTPQAGDAAQTLFETLGEVVRVSSSDAAEAIKLFANVHRDLAFAEANQFALVCDAARLDYAEIAAAGAQGYPRFSLARPGPVGGPCLTKDLHVLAASPDLGGMDLGLLKAARKVNESLAVVVARRVQADLPRGAAVAVLGLAFKGCPETRDRRGAFGGDLAKELRAGRRGLDLRLWDPGDVDSPQAALQDAAVVVLANDHPALAAIAAGLPAGTILYDLASVVADPPAGVIVRRLGGGASP